MNRVKAIIPCAGFGSRMGMNSHESKEMLTDPVTGKYIIDYSLDLCKRYSIDALVIVRKDKQDLIQYLTKERPEVEIFIHEPAGEWMDTVLASKSWWEEKNILILPDTRFEPEEAVFDIAKKLDTHSLVFGLHDQEVKLPWGVVQYNSGNVWTSEKPSHKVMAWGIIGFHSSEGSALFEHYKNPGSWKNFSGASVELYKFVDITRSGRLEKY